MNGRANGGGYGGYDVNPYAMGPPVSSSYWVLSLLLQGGATPGMPGGGRTPAAGRFGQTPNPYAVSSSRIAIPDIVNIPQGGFGGGKTPNPYAGTTTGGRTPATGWAGSGGKTPGWAGSGGKTPATGGLGAGGRTPAVGMGGAGGRTPAPGFGAAGGRTPSGMAGGRTPNPYAAPTPAATGSSRVSKVY